MRVKLETITPKKAKEWLEKRNTYNRAMRPSWVATLVGYIKAGKWKMTGDSIKFAKDGTLLDGQHRLAACVESGVAIQSLVVYGLEEDMYAWLDQGKPRTLSVVACPGQWRQPY